MSDEDLLEEIRDRYREAELRFIGEVGLPTANAISRDQWFREYLRDVRSLLHMVDRFRAPHRRSVEE